MTEVAEKRKRGRPKGSKNKPKEVSTLDNTMYTYRCPDGCEMKFLSDKGEGVCGKHHKVMVYVRDR